MQPSTAVHVLSVPSNAIAAHASVAAAVQASATASAASEAAVYSQPSTNVHEPSVPSSMPGNGHAGGGGAVHVSSTAWPASYHSHPIAAVMSLHLRSLVARAQPPGPRTSWASGAVHSTGRAAYSGERSGLM